MNTGYLLAFGALIVVQYYRLSLYKKRVSLSYQRIQNGPARSYLSYFVRVFLLFSAWVLMTHALPKFGEQTGVMQTKQHIASENILPKVDEVAFVVDLSASMGVKDTSDGSARLVRAKEIISQMIEELGGINASLIGFTANAATVVPDTLDYLYFRILMDSTGINDTEQAGTNLLAMVDYIKARYVGTPYNKQVRIVLFTDGEDTGFLGLDDAAKKASEKTLLEHLASTVSDKLRWDVVGLGSAAGAQVPDVTYEGRPVVSQLHSDLLQSMADVGKGHYYQESDVPLTEIADDLFAAVAGTASGQEFSDVVVKRPTLESWLLLFSAALLLYFACVLPEAEKRAVV